MTEGEINIFPQILKLEFKAQNKAQNLKSDNKKASDNLGGLDFTGADGRI